MKASGSASFRRTRAPEAPFLRWQAIRQAPAPAFARAAAELEPRARFAKVDTEAHPELAARYGIRAIPTTVLFRGGQEVARVSGAMDHPRLVQWVSQHL